MFALTLMENSNLFAEVPEVMVGVFLEGYLAESVPLGLASNTEKARSEFIVAPVLVELRRRLGHRVSVFSGVGVTADVECGLPETCDFIVSHSRQQLYLEASIGFVVIVATNENLMNGFGRCVAEMVGAQAFNEARGVAGQTVYGVVTTGNLWKFFALSGTVVQMDAVEYHINAVSKVLGILQHLLEVA